MGDVLELAPRRRHPFKGDAQLEAERTEDGIQVVKIVQNGRYHEELKATGRTTLWCNLSGNDRIKIEVVAGKPGEEVWTGESMWLWRVRGTEKAVFESVSDM